MSVLILVADPNCLSLEAYLEGYSRNILHNKKTYAELLRHPKWLARRQDIIARDGFKCAWCSNEDGYILHVHHLVYTTYYPWNEPRKHLISLCSSCHFKAHFGYYFKAKE